MLSGFATAAVALVIGILIYLVIGGYSGGSSHTNVAPVLFPVAFLVFLIVGLPTILVCALSWAGFAISARRERRKRDGPAPDEPASRAGTDL